MSVLVNDPDFTLYVGDVLEQLRELPDESVHCVVTSPPYWGLRDYSTPGQIGLEATPDLFVAAMVDVFREVRRVLRADGTCWVNLGDSYAQAGGTKADDKELAAAAVRAEEKGYATQAFAGYKGWQRASGTAVGGLKPKDLCGIPWRVAFALQADGWYLRSDIVWSKPNPMPESVTDRPTKAHEMIFLLTKGEWTGPPKGQCGDVSDEDARWLALLFDTEGNIVIKRGERDERVQYGAQVALANTNRALLERARAIVGTGSIHERRGTNAPMFYWQLSGRQARDLLYRIYPFLIVKPRQARVAIHMQDVIAEPKKRPGGRRTEEHSAFLERCWQTVKALNSFGDPDLSWAPAPRYGKWGPSRYFFDQEAVREAWTTTHAPGSKVNETQHYGAGNGGNTGLTAHLADVKARLRSRPQDETLDDSEGEAPRGPDGRRVTAVKGGEGSIQHRDGERWPHPAGRNIRSVWEIATQPYPEAHFATFPEALVERCVKAGTSERGCCPVCGASWERETETERVVRSNGGPSPAHTEVKGYSSSSALVTNALPRTWTTGWRPTCDHDAAPVPATVCDPFMGSGTTALVARRLGRRSIGIELNPDYAALCARRLQQLSLFAGEPS